MEKKTFEYLRSGESVVKDKEDLDKWVEEHKEELEVEDEKEE
jgi:hypothetical protein